MTHSQNTLQMTKYEIFNSPYVRSKKHPYSHIVYEIEYMGFAKPRVAEGYEQFVKREKQVFTGNLSDCVAFIIAKENNYIK